VFDKNEMEASGYASALATLSGEPVYKVKFYNNDEDPLVRFVDKVMQVRKEGGLFPPLPCPSGSLFGFHPTFHLSILLQFLSFQAPQLISISPFVRRVDTHSSMLPIRHTAAMEPHSY
jgi:hypothetical protein